MNNYISSAELIIVKILKNMIISNLDVFYQVSYS